MQIYLLAAGFSILRHSKSSIVPILLEDASNKVHTKPLQKTQAFILQKQLIQSNKKRQVIHTMRWVGVCSWL